MVITQELMIEQVRDNLRVPQRLILNVDGSFLVEPLQSGLDAEFVLFTSGTTGEPKAYVHRLSELEKGVKRGTAYVGLRWGLCYPVNHLAGLLVTLQALLNDGELVSLYGRSIGEQLEWVRTKAITHLSATPTLMRQWISNLAEPIESVKQITLGGEPVDDVLINSLHIRFPQARITNIYALTEVGTVLKSSSEWFRIPEALKSKIKINNDNIIEIYLNNKETSLAPDSFTADEDFGRKVAPAPLRGGNETNSKSPCIITGDEVEFHEKDGELFRIVGRRGNGVNVGGFWVSPQAVENRLRSVEGVIDVRVSGRSNSVLGTVLTCEVMLGEEMTVSLLRDWTEKNLPPYQIPRLIEAVDQFELTRSGKIKR